MLLQEPGHSPYDLRFQLLGFPVRICWTFWLAGLVFGYQFARGMDARFEILDPGSSPGFAPLLLLWTVCLLVSILIHELGHAVAYRRYGIEASVVLYHFGGLAIPTSSFSPGRGFGMLSPKQSIWVSVAGPLAQIASAVLLVAAVKAAGYRVTAFAMMPGPPFYKIPGVLQGAEIEIPGLFALVAFYIFPSVLWALLNLIPVLPLDGGNIMRSIVQLTGGNVSQALWVSVIAGGLMAAYGFSIDHHYMGLLFLVLAVSNFQALQQTGGTHY
jgi:Zn-dependent protease